jgi:hypothetical protein
MVALPRSANRYSGPTVKNVLSGGMKSGALHALSFCCGTLGGAMMSLNVNVEQGAGAESDQLAYTYTRSSRYPATWGHP